MIANFISIHPILTYIIIGIVIGVSAMVAVVVTIITYTNLRSAQHKNAIAVKEEPLAHTQTVSKPVDKAAPKHRASLKTQLSFLKNKLAFIRFRRSTQQNDVSSEQPPVEQAPHVPEIILNAVNLEPEINATEPVFSLPLTELQPASEAMEVATLITDTSPVSLAEAAQLQEEAESINPVETSATEENEYQEQPAGKDDAFSLFTVDTAEESASNKFAADLNNVDVNDLLADALKFRNQFSKVE